MLEANIERLSLWESASERLFGTNPGIPPSPPDWPNGQIELVAFDESDSLPDPRDIPVENIESAITSADYGAINRDEAAEAMAKAGMDAVAFYAPISTSGQTWGVYYNERIFFGLVTLCSRSLKSDDWHSIAVELLHLINRHELFHAVIELLALVRDDHRHWPLSFGKDDSVEPLNVKQSAFWVYHNEIYRPAWPLTSLEESLATANEFRRVFSNSGLRAVLVDIISTAPPAYAAWVKYSSAREFEVAYHDLAAAVLAGTQQWTAARVLARFPDDDASEPRLWLPPTEPEHIASFGGVPRYVWRSDKNVPPFFSQGIFGNLRTRQLLGCLTSRFGAELRSGGRHLAVVFPSGAKVPYSSSWTTVPPFFVRQVAIAAGVRQAELLDTCA